MAWPRALGAVLLRPVTLRVIEEAVEHVAHRGGLAHRATVCVDAVARHAAHHLARLVSDDEARRNPGLAAVESIGAVDAAVDAVDAAGAVRREQLCERVDDAHLATLVSRAHVLAQLVEHDGARHRQRRAACQEGAAEAERHALRLEARDALALVEGDGEVLRVGGARVMHEDEHLVHLRVDEVGRAPTRVHVFRHHAHRDRDILGGLVLVSGRRLSEEKPRLSSEGQPRPTWFEGAKLICSGAAAARAEGEVAVEDHGDAEVGFARRDHEHLEVKRLHRRLRAAVDHARVVHVERLERARVLLGVIPRLEGEDDAPLLLDVHDVDGLVLRVDVEDEHEGV
mmetsp:Transcript_53340/g.127887  ORF Transcript_53340/g.127887 Transcript_53340/m.127887 type:complete len:341 (-) Transcript_53340:324-1346(-)